MPTPRAHGGAALAPINITSPAARGLNTAEAASLLDPAWATKLNNAVFDGLGRPAVRKGFSNNTTTPYDGTQKLIKRIFEYWQADGTSEIISSTDDNILSGVVDLSDATASIDGTLSISDGNIKFVNFNDKCIGLGIGTSGNPAVYTGTGTFATITVNSGTAPTSGIGNSCFGRLWVVDTDGHTIRFSALLDETRWATADGGGTIDMASVWPSGQDKVIAIEEFGADLAIIGTKDTVIWTDGQGSTLGLNPLFMYVSDTLPGVGAVSQFAVCRAMGDLYMLSPNGVLSLKRELVQRSTPSTNVSKNIQSDVVLSLGAEASDDDITLMYSPSEEFILLIFPSCKCVFVFDSKGFLDDGTLRATSWDGDLQTAAYIRDDRSVRASLSQDAGGSTTGEIYSYSGYFDDGQTYNFEYESGWLNLGPQAEQYLKFVKRMTSVVFIEADTTVTHTIGYDFGPQSVNKQRSATGGSASEYNIAEYGANGSRDPNDSDLTAGVDVSEYSASIQLQTLKVPGAGGGQYIKIGVTVNNAGGQFSLQQVNLFAKIGRVAA